MGNYYSGEHIAEDHILTDLTTCNIEELKQKHCLGTDRNRFLEALNMFYWIQTLALSFCSGSKLLVRMKVYTKAELRARVGRALTS